MTCESLIDLAEIWYADTSNWNYINKHNFNGVLRDNSCHHCLRTFLFNHTLSCFNQCSVVLIRQTETATTRSLHEIEANMSKRFRATKCSERSQAGNLFKCKHCTFQRLTFGQKRVDHGAGKMWRFETSIEFQKKCRQSVAKPFCENFEYVFFAITAPQQQLAHGIITKVKNSSIR